MGAFTFEDVGVTAYNGAGPPCSTSATYLAAAAGIMSVEAYHAAEVRTVLVYGDPLYLGYAAKISALRGTASASTGETSGPAETVPASNAIVAADMNSLAYARTTNQVLHIVYLNATAGAVTMGGFFPNGMNGTIKASTK